MTIVAQILDERDEGGPRCFLSKISLQDYIGGLPDDYRDYDVQREIVTNVYLDRLVDTVLHKRHIPPIVLVIEAGEFEIKGNTLIIEKLKILDGLQRTFRLDVIKKTIDYALDEVGALANGVNELLELSRYSFSRRFSESLRELDSNTNILRSIVQAICDHGQDFVVNAYLENNQWFEIWTNLTPAQEVQKMLTLNAGHKSVKTRHQLELLFLHLLSRLHADADEKFTIHREREISSTQFSKNREIGQYHFAHVISALLSFGKGSPVAPTTALVQSIQDDSDEEGSLHFVSPQVLIDFMRFLVNLDRLLSQHYPKHGRIWLGREVTLAGMFAAVGKSAIENDENWSGALDQFLEQVKDNPEVLALDAFEAARNNVDLSKVNIGNVNRTAVFSAISKLIDSNQIEPIDWDTEFGGGDS
jgi:hypothetical protein